MSESYLDKRKYASGYGGRQRVWRDYTAELRWQYREQWMLCHRPPEGIGLDGYPLQPGKPFKGGKKNAESDDP